MANEVERAEAATLRRVERKGALRDEVGLLAPRTPPRTAVPKESCGKVLAARGQWLEAADQVALAQVRSICLCAQCTREVERGWDQVGH